MDSEAIDASGYELAPKASTEGRKLCLTKNQRYHYSASSISFSLQKEGTSRPEATGFCEGMEAVSSIVFPLGRPGSIREGGSESVSQSVENSLR